MKKNFKKVNAAIIVIGNEILSGRTQDLNVSFISKWLNEKNGISVHEVRVIPDVEKIIVKTTNELRKKYNYIFTTGGIGPTHDDITSDSVACALGKKLILNTEAKRRLEKHYADDVLTKARLKMAYMPENSTLIDNPVSVAPGFSIQNIFVFPGVPKIMQVMFKEKVKSFDEGLRYYKKTISTTLSEGIIGEYIEKIQNKFNTLEIGSYPYFKKNSFGVSLVIKGEKDLEVSKASDEIYNYIESINGNPEIF